MSAPPNPAPRAYTVAQVAAALQLPYKKTLRLVQDGVIHGRRFGQHWRIPDLELERLLRDMAGDPAA